MIKQVWVGDITYFKVVGYWWYLAIVMDQFSRRILSWSLTPPHVGGHLRDAPRGRPPSTCGGCNLSPRSRYGIHGCGVLCRRCGPRHAPKRECASVRGPGDNAHAASFRHSLKAKLTRGVAFLTDHALRTVLRQYIRHYNRTRLHSSLNCTSPIAFERCAALSMSVHENGARSRALW